jgi:hypothetical protein
MVLKASLLRLRITEIPINFYKDRQGRTSHHKRSGWFSPWRAGWINLKVMFLFAPDFFLFWPSLVMIVLGLALVLGLVHRPRTIGPIGFGLHWMLLGVTLSTLGYGGLHLALLAKAYYNFKPAVTAWITRLITYNRGMIAGGVLLFAGFAMDLVLAVHYAASGFRDLESPYTYYGYGVLGLLLIMLGFQTVTHTLILQMVLFARRRKSG